MSVPIWCELVCRTCASTTSGQFTYDTIKRRNMVKDAKERGWVFRDDECFCSEQCLRLTLR